MSPYIEGVVKQIADIGARQLQEKYLPAVGEEFIRAGQFGPGRGSTRMGEFGARALRDVQEAVLGEQAKALQAGYGQAAEIFGRDTARAAQLAGTAGELGSAQQRTIMEAGAKVGELTTSDLNRLLVSGQSIADIGSKMANLSADDATRLIQIGQSTGQLTAQDAERLVDIAKTRGQLTAEDAARALSAAELRGALTDKDAARTLEAAQLTGKLTADDAARLSEIAQAKGALAGEDANRIANLASITGNLTAQDAKILADIGQIKGQLTQADAKNLQDLADKYLGMGEAAQTLGIREGEALESVGEKKRKMDQANLDLAYEDFLKQEADPKERIKFMSEILKNINLPETRVSETTTTPAQPGGEPNIEKIIKGAGGVDALIELFKKYFK
jgi:hypothetical protein